MINFIQLHSIEEIEQFIQEHNLAFLYMTQPNCSVCHGLRPQIEAILSKYPNIYSATINASEVPQVASCFQVFTAPVLLLFVDGKEFVREARIVHTKKFVEKLDRIYKYVENQ